MSCRLRKRRGFHKTRVERATAAKRSVRSQRGGDAPTRFFPPLMYRQRRYQQGRLREGGRLRKGNLHSLRNSALYITPAPERGERQRSGERTREDRSARRCPPSPAPRETRCFCLKEKKQKKKWEMSQPADSHS